MQKTIIAALLFFTLLSSGCLKKLTEDPKDGSMTALENGKGISYNYCTFLGPNYNQLTIMATPTLSASTPDIMLTINHYNGPGTYVIGDTSSNTAIIDSNITSTAPPAVSGSITISTLSATQVTGSFNFVGSNGTIVSNGKFTANAN
jgi:hypothetical protein